MILGMDSTHSFLGPLAVLHGDCPYYPDRRPTRTIFARPDSLQKSEWQTALDMGMRRAGGALYRPICQGCRKCLPVRIPVQDFVPSHAQRRVWNHAKGNFEIIIGRPQVDQARLDLYRAYLAFQHDQELAEQDCLENYEQFLVETRVDTIELSFRDHSGELAGVSILDATNIALSSVYFYWGAQYRKFSLGIYSVLEEIELCKRMGLTYYYFGYLVPDVPAMEYKGRFAPLEMWDGKDWVMLGNRNLRDERVRRQLVKSEEGAAQTDMRHFGTQEIISTTS